MKFQRALVTGGLGLIGSHLVERLLDERVHVTVIDNNFTGDISNLGAYPSNNLLKVISGDIVDSVLINEEMREVEFCFHLAAALGVKRILSAPITSYKTNIHGSENVLSAASKHKVPVFLASSSEIYGKNSQQPLTEDSDRVLGSPLNIRWSYSEAKALDESLAQMYAQEEGLKFVIGRFFNTVGPRQTGDYGMVLPRFVSSALKNQDLEVYGDGTQTRVFCHVQDAVDGLIGLVENESTFGEAFNIGGVGEVSINELAAKVIEVTKSQSKIRHVPYSQAYSKGFEETFRRVPETTKIRNLTGWQVKRGLEDIIRDVMSFMKSK
jgi:UDP-glucose 4-epimerase